MNQTEAAVEFSSLFGHAISILAKLIFEVKYQSSPVQSSDCRLPVQVSLLSNQYCGVDGLLIVVMSWQSSIVSSKDCNSLFNSISHFYCKQSVSGVLRGEYW